MPNINQRLGEVCGGEPEKAVLPVHRHERLSYAQKNQSWGRPVPIRTHKENRDIFVALGGKLVAPTLAASEAGMPTLLEAYVELSYYDDAGDVVVRYP